MNIRQLILLNAAALAAWTNAVYAGPCSQEIGRVQVQIDAKLEANTTLSAPESTEARLHRQPTPGSIAAAESGLGQLSSQTMEAIRAGMARAREADGEGNQSACEQALAEVQRLIGR